MISPKLFYRTFALTLVTSIGLTACAPAIGSKEWCEDLKQKPKSDWTAYDAKEFAKSCVL
jgi:hypothetical protein